MDIAPTHRANSLAALKQIALQARKKNDPDANLADDDWLEAHPEVCQLKSKKFFLFGTVSRAVALGTSLTNSTQSFQMKHLLTRYNGSVVRW